MAARPEGARADGTDGGTGRGERGSPHPGKEKALAQPVILGKLSDYLTGRTIDDTEDERHRQKVARFLVAEKGYLKTDIRVQRELPVMVDGGTWVVRLDFCVVLEGKTVLIVRFAPGSLVSRERPALAAAMLLEPYRIPYAVVTNGNDAHLLDTASGDVIGQGLAAIPSRAELVAQLSSLGFDPISETRLEKERRILFMFEAVATCPVP
jgi:hypothetical protein